MLVALFALFSPVASAEGPVAVTEYKSEESEAILWDFIQSYTEDEYITAGIMGYFWRESFFRSDAVAGWPTILAVLREDHCQSFTVKIDEGLKDGTTKDEFIRRSRYQYGGYGLGQWSSEGFLEDYYDFASEWGTTIADAEMQCAFVVQSLRGFERIWEQLEAVQDPESAGRIIGLQYDGSESGYLYMGQMASIFYGKYAVEG